MKSEIRVSSPNIKTRFVIGLFATILVIFLAVVFRFEFGIILLAIGGTIGVVGLAVGAGVVGKILYRFRVWNLDTAIKKQELRITTAKANKAELESFVLSFPSSQRQLVSPNAPVRLIEANYKALPDKTLTAHPVELLTELDTVQRCLVVGATDTGKTTLMQHIVYRRLQTSQVIVIDPHSWPDKWPGCKVIGNGRNYQEIDRALTALLQIMTKRYDEIGRGAIIEGMHPRLTILIDEWRAIVFNLGNPASDAIKALLTESRKAAFSVFVATHSDRAKPLGLQGEYDLKDGFAIVRLSIVNGQRQATFDTGNGEAPASLPGPFMGGGIVEPGIDSSDFINLEPEPSPMEAEILRLYEQGESYNEIARRVFGHTGGKQTEQIKQVIGKFN